MKALRMHWQAHWHNVLHLLSWHCGTGQSMAGFMPHSRESHRTACLHQLVTACRQVQGGQLAPEGREAGAWANHDDGRSRVLGQPEVRVLVHIHRQHVAHLGWRTWQCPVRERWTSQSMLIPRTSHFAACTLHPIISKYRLDASGCQGDHGHSCEPRFTVTTWHLDALGELGGGDTNAVPVQALVANDRDRDLHPARVLQLRRRDGVQPRQQRPQRAQHLRTCAKSGSSHRKLCLPCVRRNIMHIAAFRYEQRTWQHCYVYSGARGGYFETHESRGGWGPTPPCPEADVRVQSPRSRPARASVPSRLQQQHPPSAAMFPIL